MSNRKLYAISTLCLLLNGALLAQGCIVTGHPAAAATWGSPASSSDLESTLEQPGPIEVLTHLHLDHIMGMPDVPRGTPVFRGKAPKA